MLNYDYEKQIIADISYKLALMKGYTGTFDDFTKIDNTNPTDDITRLSRATNGVSGQLSVDLSPDELKDYCNIPEKQRAALFNSFLDIRIKDYGMIQREFTSKSNNISLHDGKSICITIKVAALFNGAISYSKFVSALEDAAGYSNGTFPLNKALLFPYIELALSYNNPGIPQPGDEMELKAYYENII